MKWMGKAVLRWTFSFVLWRIKRTEKTEEKKTSWLSLWLSRRPSLTKSFSFHYPHNKLLLQAPYIFGDCHQWLLQMFPKKLLNTYGIAILGKSWSLRSWIVRSWLVIVIITICLFPEQFFRYQRNGRCTHHCACNPNTYSNSEARGLGAIVQCRLKWI